MNSEIGSCDNCDVIVREDECKKTLYAWVCIKKLDETRIWVKMGSELIKSTTGYGYEETDNVIARAIIKLEFKSFEMVEDTKEMIKIDLADCEN